MKKKVIIPTILAMIAMIILCTTSVFAASKATPGKVALNKISSSAYNKISISWKKAANTTHYRIYYRTSNSSWKRIATVPASQTSYTHTSSKSYPIIVGQKYTYTVKGYNSSSKKLGTCDMNGLTKNTVPDEPKLKKPVGNDNGTVTLNWSKANGCNYYCVFRRTSPSESWVKLANLKSNVYSYTDKKPISGKENIYTVRGYYSKTKVYGRYTKGISIILADVVIDDGTEPTQSDIMLASKVLELTNKERAKEGLKPLAYNPTLQKAAMLRARELAESFSHTRPNGTPWYTAVSETGASYACAENIAGGTLTSEGVIQVWMDSPGHRANILKTNATHVGIGHYMDMFGTHYWVQDFTNGDPDVRITMTFDPMGGEGGYTLKVAYGQQVYLKDIPIPTKEGYTFNGWYDIYNQKLESIYATEDLTFYADWI